MWRSRIRESISWVLVLVVLALLGTYVWATYHPEHRLIARAADWPGVGSLVERFRVYYGVSDEQVAARQAAASRQGLGEQTEPYGVPAEGGEWEYPVGQGSVGTEGRAAGALPADAPGVTAPRRTSGPRRASGGYRSQSEKVWIAAGDAVRRGPQGSSPAVGQVESFEQVKVLERRGDWVRVESSAGAGWVEAPAAAESYPLGTGLVPTGPLDGASPPDDYVVAARDLMGVSAANGRLGPYELYTDVDPPSRLAHLDRLAAQVEPAYRKRYGRAPRGQAREAILVFTDEDTYRVLQSREARIRGIPAGGHAGHGMLALWVGDRQRHELAATLVHEIVHLLNRRSLGPALPPWLDEGMADDLGSSKIGSAGDLEPGALGGLLVRGKGRLDFFGALAGLRNLNASFARADAPRVEELVDLEWNDFVRDGRRDLNYAHAGFFVRYLVEGEDGALAPGFRRFLDGVAAGRAPTGEALRRELGKSWEELDRGLGDYVRKLILETTPRSGRGEG